MYQYELPRYLPTADELPCSDDTPVDEDWSRRKPPAKEVRNELQEIIPSLLKSILRILWNDRMDWSFGIDMGIYSHPERPPIVPDGFLCLNVERHYDEDLRLSYLLWEEEIPPILVLEVVSTKPGGEYTTKLDEYTRMGVLYYVIYNPKRRRKPRLEIHKLVNGKYELQDGNPIWMPEIGLGIGSERASYDRLTREWLYWYDENNRRYPTPDEQIERADRLIEQERQQTELERQRADRLEAKLRALGIDPE
jgi:Uma2 family endonuclease